MRLGAYRCIVADPPWAPDDQLPGDTRGSSRNYNVLTQAQLEGFLSDQAHARALTISLNAILFLWRLASMQTEALAVVNAWGFRQLSEVVWCKLTKEGKPWFGMGRTVRGAHETALICVRGPATRLIAAKNIRSVFEAPVPVDARGDYIHSAKPPEFFSQVVEPLIGGTARGGPCLELFARRRRPNWHAIGDQLPAD